MRLEVLAAASLAALVGCNKSAETFTTRVVIDRVTAFGAGGAPSVLDVELSYPDCPGREGAVIRGDKDFAACAQKLKSGDQVQAEISFAYKADRQQYRSDVVKLGDCVRKVDPKDDATYESLRACDDVTIHGVSMGVHCNKTRSPELVAKCPWFTRK